MEFVIQQWFEETFHRKMRVNVELLKNNHRRG